MESDNNSIIVINVSGRRFEVSLLTLASHPSILSRLHVDSPYYLPYRNEYFFERHAPSFEAILYYYQTGELHVPPSVCMGVFKSELRFWGLSAEHMRTCCKGPYGGYISKQESLVELERHLYTDDNRRLMIRMGRCGKFRMAAWEFLNNPSSSNWALVYFWFVFAVICMSVLSLILHSDKSLERPLSELDTPEFVKQFVRKFRVGEGLIRTNKTFVPDHKIMAPNPHIGYLEWCSAAFFLLDFISRFTFCPNKFKFLRQDRHVVDMLCLAPYAIWVIAELSITHFSSYRTVLWVVEGWSSLRVLRLFYLTQVISGLRVMMYTLRASIKELFFLWVMLCVSAGLFGSLVFYCDEFKDDSGELNYQDINVGIWWAMITMTTVGYGDKVPKSFWAKGVGILCAVFGVVIIAITIPILSNNFIMYYDHMEGAPMLKPRRDGFIKRCFKRIFYKDWREPEQELEETRRGSSYRGFTRVPSTLRRKILINNNMPIV